MADLFDMNANGMGFHLTSHLIAIVALFVACFAIAGYITYRDNSVPAGAIKDGLEFDDENITAASLTSLGALTVSGNATVNGSLLAYKMASDLTTTVTDLAEASTTVMTTAAYPSGSVIGVDFTGAGTSAVTLPPCELGYRLTFYYKTAMGGANAQTYTCAAGNSYASGSFAAAGGIQDTAGTAFFSDGTDTIFTVTSAITNNGWGPGSYIELVGLSATQWQLRGLGAPEGTGTGAGAGVFS